MHELVSEFVDVHFITQLHEADCIKKLNSFDELLQLLSLLTVAEFGSDPLLLTMLKT